MKFEKKEPTKTLKEKQENKRQKNIEVGRGGVEAEYKKLLNCIKTIAQKLQLNYNNLIILAHTKICLKTKQRENFLIEIKHSKDKNQNF